MLFATPEALAQFVKPWAKFYEHSDTANTIVTFLHIGAVVVGGGMAIFLDRAALRLRLDDPNAKAMHLRELGALHPIVLTALAISFVSGLALLASDLDTFLPSWVFWLKMVLIGVLLANGALMQRLEKQLGGPGGGTADQWRRLRGIAITSLSLWLVITFAGVVLTNIG